MEDNTNINNEEERMRQTVYNNSKYKKCIAKLNSVSSFCAARFITKVAFVILIWSVIIIIADRLEKSSSGSYDYDRRMADFKNLFGLSVVFTCSVFFGDFISCLRLPNLLGMLLAGLLITNVESIDAAKYIYKSWSVTLRNIALVVILLRSGLELDPVALKKLKRTVIFLAFGPCIAEALTVAVVANLLLELPWLWGLQLGFVLGAVSPAIVVPQLLKLQEQGFGVNEGIPTLVMAASSCDDVLAISLFTVFLGIAFSTGNLVFNIFRGPIEILLGITIGCVSGFLLSFIPSNQQRQYLYEKRFIMLLSLGILMLVGMNELDFSGAGALAVLTTAFVAAHGWTEEGKLPVVKLVDKLWLVFEPFMFGLVGAEVKMEYMTARLIGRGIAVLLFGLSLRILVTYLVTYGNSLSLKERLFICVAWLPKATVQAAIGAVSLETAIKHRYRSGIPGTEEEYGKSILTLAVLVILITAPVGAVGIAVAGPRLLQRRNNAVEPAAASEEEIGLTVDETATQSEL